MPKLTKKAIRFGRSDVRTYRRTYPNYRKALLLTIAARYIFKYKLDFHKSITDAPTDQVQYQVDAYRSAESS